MQDAEIVELYWLRDPRAIEETDGKYGAFCRSIAYRICQNADLPNSFLFIIVKSGTGETGTGAPVTDGSLNAGGWASITKEDLETLADCFDYGIVDSIE